MVKMIEAVHLQKKYQLYEKPVDRLKEVFSIKHKKYHDEFYALRDISLTINKGESVGIVGVNGSGKSTLLKLITGVLNPTEGVIKTYGKIAALLELGAGFNPDYSGYENVFLNGTMMGYTQAEMKERVQQIVEFADIGAFIDQPVKTYSSGMFARLAFAVAINVEPDILIVDEALAVGDTRFQVKCINKMKELRDKGTTILFVSHATEQIKRFCTRTIWLKDGYVYRDGEASQIVDLYDNFMKFGESVLKETVDDKESIIDSKRIQGSQVEGGKESNEDVENKEIDMPAIIHSVEINKTMFRTFEKLELKIVYEILDDEINDFLVGAAIYSKDRMDYVFGPNTYLDKKKLSGKKGKYCMSYSIESLPLISGEYVMDVGIFNNEGIVNFDYKMSIVGFEISNSYFSEGMFYIEHDWKEEKI